MLNRGAALLLLALLCGGCSGAEPRALLLATTTSLHDAGLLDVLLPEFTRETDIRVRVIAVGTGAALRMGSEGNADVLLTHAPDAERALVADGVVSDRVPVMENYFVIAGPADDPVGIASLGSAAEALRRIEAAGAPWISRGDDSGTHRRERALWREAGLDPDPSWDGFTSTGAGMGLSLQVAGERRAYLLSDLGTLLAFRERTGLVALSKPEPALRNVYSLLRVNPARFGDRIQADAAARLEEFLLRPDVQRRIGGFGVDRFGQPLFMPLREEATDG